MSQPGSDDRDDDRESNPFVVFRRFADDHIASVFSRFSEPVDRDLARHDQAWRDAQRDAWRRFESSYERTTNPERRQTEQRSPDDPVHAASATGSDAERRPPSLFGRTLTAMGKTSKEEEAARAIAPVADRMRSEEQQSQESGRMCGRRSHGPPFSVESSDNGDGGNVPRHEHGQFGPFSWSWSWGPWNMENRGTRDESSDKEMVTHTHTMGPWSFGPFHVGPMTASATTPKEVETQMINAISRADLYLRDPEKLETDLKELTSGAERGSHTGELPSKVEAELRNAMSVVHGFLGRDFPFAAVEADQQTRDERPGSYSPMSLSTDKDLGRRLDWCSAFEDLMAAEKGEELHGPTREARTGVVRPGLHSEWFQQMMSRDLIDRQSPWHRDLFHMREPLSSQRVEEVRNEQGPESELDYYEKQELSRSGVVSEQQSLDKQPQKQSILSTISSVERVMQPDASITTKRTLRRRFADGTEESEDSTEQVPASPFRQRTQAVEPAKPQTVVEGDETAKTKGWFW